MAEQPPPADAADGAPLPSAAYSEYSSDSDDETWEERAWRHLITKASFSEWTYPRAKLPYRKFVPQIPFFMHLGGAQGQRLRVWMPQTVVFGLGPDPGSEGLEQCWLMNSRDGYVHRCDSFNPDVDVVKAFQSADPYEIVAVFKRRHNGVAQRQLLTSEDLGVILSQSA